MTRDQLIAELRGMLSDLGLDVHQYAVIVQAIFELGGKP